MAEREINARWLMGAKAADAAEVLRDAIMAAKDKGITTRITHDGEDYAVISPPGKEHRHGH